MLWQLNNRSSARRQVQQNSLEEFVHWQGVTRP